MAPSTPTGTFPPIRACIFDMDGLLINTEDIYKACADNVLARHGRPSLPWSIKAQLMGVPGSSNGDVFHAWAQLPISREQFRKEQEEEQEKLFPLCEPLPGAGDLLAKLIDAGVEIALATSSESYNYERKTRRVETKRLLDLIPKQRRVLADDDRMKSARGKPAGDIFLVALEGINSSLDEGNERIKPEECLVFEDSVPGVEAGRRAGMRVVWVPHEGLAAYFKGREGEVLAGRTGLVPIGDESELGEVGDGWAEQVASLEDVDLRKYGILGRSRPAGGF